MTLTVADPVVDHEVRWSADELLDALQVEDRFTQLMLSLAGPDLTRPSAVLFGIDGTLLTGPPCHLHCLAGAAGARAGRPVGVEMWRGTPVVDGHIAGGWTDAQLFRAILGGDAHWLLEGALDDYTRRYQTALELGASPGEPVAGCAEMLDQLALAGIGLGVATGIASQVAQLRLQATGLADRFPVDRNAGFGDWRSGRVEVVKAAIRALGARTAKSTWLVGDTAEEMRAARELNLTGIGVLTGSDTADRLQGAGAATVIRSAAELVDLVPGDDQNRWAS